MSSDLVSKVEDRLSTIRQQRAAHKADLDTLLAAPKRGQRDLTATESAKFDRLIAEIRSLDTEAEDAEIRIVELEEQQKREANAARVRVETGMTGSQRFYAGSGHTYRPDGEHSFFGDLISARRGDYQAAERLSRNNSERFETRAGDMTTVAGAGGEFAPPLWLVEQYVNLARPGRVTADLTTRAPLPPGVSTVNLPAVSTGTTTAVQATQNSALSDTAMTTTSVSSGITTIGGKQIVSLQLLQQSGAPFDQVIFKDLAADHAQRLNLQVLYGIGSGGQLAGISGVTGLNTVTYTTTSPTVASTTAANSFLHQIISAKNKVETGIFRAPTAVVMHPRRWNWVLDALDGQSRPLVTPDGQQFNGPGLSTSPTAEGAAGTLAGLPVYLDPSISVTANSATNQDEVYVVKADELYLYESPVQAESFEATYADNASVLLRLLNYASFIGQRRPKAISVIRGTGMIDPGL